MGIAATKPRDRGLAIDAERSMPSDEAIGAQRPSFARRGAWARAGHC
jgi:hypothetical protein